LECEFEQARKYLINSKAATRGSRLSAADHNLAHLQITTGRFEEALSTLARISIAAPLSRLRVLGVFDARARIFLALNQLDKCVAALEQVDREVAADPSLAHFFSVRWSVVTKARLLLRRDRSDEALKFLQAADHGLTDVDDNPLKALIRITAAQALVKSGRPGEAAAQIVHANRLGVAGFRELQGQYYYACASMFGPEFPARRAGMARRARTLWKAQGIVSLPLEMDAAASTAGTDADRSVPGRKAIRSTESAAAQVVDATAAILDLAHTPPAMASELLALIETVCSERATLVDGAAGEGFAPSTDAAVVISLGQHRDRDLAVVCSVPKTPERAAALAAVTRIAEAAVALETSRREEGNRAALWPEDPVEEQAGALFVAEDMQSLLATARRVAPTTVSVLITGETGTGKEVLARTIHAYSARAKGTFLPFNCTSIPRDMLDSQLFGHRRGAFTGATEHFQGVIRAAAGGTLFLDEIGDMPSDVQPKLLRFLESGEVHPIGETHPVRADVRVIAATNANLDAFVTEGRFREDLFYRLNIVRLHLPPLRERRIEIPALATHYLRKHAQEYGKADLGLAEETMEYLLLYRWPGNVRQLANEMRRMAALSEPGAILMPEHLSPEIAASRRTIPPSERTLDRHEVVVRMDQPIAAATAHLEQAMLQYALHKTGGRMEDTAALLGLSRKGLYLKRQRYGIDPPGDVSAGAA
jgi:DNA-binding NtrC family response regulator